MRRVEVLSMALCTAPLLGAGEARAERITDAAYSLSADHAEVLLHTSAAIGAPRIRVAERRVRIWFPGIDEDVRMRLPTDGELITAATLRPGAERSSLLMLTAGKGVVLDAQAVQVVRDGNRARVLIERSERTMPGLSARSAARAVEAEARVGAATKAEPAAATAAPTPPQQQGAVADEPASTDTEALSDTLGRKNGSALSGLGSQSASDAETASGRGFNAGLLLLASLLLGMIYAGLQLVVRRKRQAQPAPPITVLGARRLGPRHQLLLVRALGEDHLLSVQAGRTEHIASVASSGGDQAAGLSLLEAHRGMHSDERSRGVGESSASSFGAQLGSLMAKRAEREAESAPQGRRSGSHPVASESVAGLLRLRNRAAS